MTPTPTNPADAAVAEPGVFSLLDWSVVGVYLCVVVAVGVLAGRKHKGGDEFFLAGRSMPMWAVAVSVLATSLSAATFIGGPQEAYKGNLTYFATNIGGLIAIIIVAAFFIPAFYRHNVTSIYELLGVHFDQRARRAASAMFMIGRVFASGARLFMVAIPFALITFGSIRPVDLMVSIVIISFVAAIYTSIGGIRAVIWTDVLQAALLVGTAIVAFFILVDRIPMGVGEIAHKLSETKAEDGSGKLTVFDTSTSWGGIYGVFAVLTGWVLFLVAAFGCDQDLVQRMLTCKDARTGAMSAVLSNLIGWPVLGVFLILGLGLYVFYNPDYMGDAAPRYKIDDSRKVFLEFIRYEMPAGLRGLTIAGLFAAAMSSLDSALNAMASTTIADFYRPWKQTRGIALDERAERRASRTAVVVWCLILAAFACFCVVWYESDKENQTLIRFALGVMMFAYSGLLAVFATAIFTRRGNATTVLGALATGFTVILLMQNGIYQHWAPTLDLPERIALPWQMVIATSFSFIVCVSGKRPTERTTP